MMYPQPQLAPIPIERAMQVIMATVNSSMSDKDKLKKIQDYVEAWFYGRKEPPQ